MSKGVSVKRSRNPDCNVCKCSPCAQEERCFRARGLSAYQARNAVNSAPPTKKKSSKPQPEMSKNKFIKQLRKANPTISDSDIKRALKKAGYSVGCLSAIVILAGSAGMLCWGGYEIAAAVWG